jgi:hypothetical protein
MLRRPVFLLACLAGCGGSTQVRPQDPPSAPSTPDAPEAAPEPPAPAETPKTPAAVATPTACAAGDTDTCAPGRAFTDYVCSASHPDIALVLFAKGTPWTRVYLRGDLDGWNAEGGGSARAKLSFDEEVIVLKRRAPPSGGAVVVGAGASYQVMRWDGNCYTLEEGEITRRKPPRPKHSGIPWTYLSDKTRTALLASAEVKAAYDKRRKECKGVTVGEVSLACERADTAFSDGIVSAVRSGSVQPPEP